MVVVDEGFDFCKVGIIVFIIIMDFELIVFKIMFDYKLELEVYNFYLFDVLIKVVEKEGIINFFIYVKLDMGMYWLGFEEKDIL